MDDSETRDALEQARELARTIDSETLQALATEAAARVARWRWADASSTVHWPDPWQQVRRTEGGSGGWRSSGGTLVQRVGLDDDGRPLVVERQFHAERELVEVWRHDERGSWMVHDLLGDTLAHVYRGPWERIELIASSRFEGRVIGAEHWTWSGDVAVRGIAAEVEADDEAETAEAFSPAPVARAYEPDVEIWCAELHRSEPLGETGALVDALATGLDAAIRAAAAPRPSSGRSSSSTTSASCIPSAPWHCRDSSGSAASASATACAR